MKPDFFSRSLDSSYFYGNQKFHLVLNYLQERLPAPANNLFLIRLTIPVTYVHDINM